MRSSSISSATKSRAESWAISEVNGRMPTLSGPRLRRSSSRSSRLVR